MAGWCEFAQARTFVATCTDVSQGVFFAKLLEGECKRKPTKHVGITAILRQAEIYGHVLRCSGH